MIAKWNEKEYEVLNSATIKKSSRETTFNDLEIEFKNGVVDDLPSYMQEITLWEDDKKIFCGYVNQIRCPELKLVDLDDKIITITLLSPRQITTKRTVTVSRTDALENIIKYILAPLVNDGFTIKEMNLVTQNLTVKYISKTIEECMNLLSNKCSFWWYIDENKNITINNIEYQFNKNAILNIDESNYIDKIKGLIKISPGFEGTDYANIINLKNARIFCNLYTSTSQQATTITMKKGDIYNFESPIDISFDTAKRMFKERYSDDTTYVINNLAITSNNSEAYIISGFNTSGTIQSGINYSNISKSDKDDKLFTLQIDNMFTNLATGIKYNGDSDITITNLLSNTALKYSTVKLINWAEINRMAGIISRTGQIEKTIDVKEKWFTVNEAIEYTRNLFIKNDKTTNKVTINYDEKNNINIGDKLFLNLPNYLTVGDFVVTDITYSESGNKIYEYTAELRNTNLLENYIDLFRATDLEEQDSQTNTEYVIEYAEEETIVESHLIEQDS